MFINKKGVIMKLDKILKPKSVALIGASTKEGSVGNELLKRMLEMNFKGEIYAIHPSEPEVLGVKAYPSVLDVKNNIDLAVIAVPAKIILNILDQCNEANIKDIVVISSGFKEIGGEGKVLEDELIAKVEKYNMNLVGPNCLGVFNTSENVSLDACFAPVIPQKGNIGFASQSGALISGTINILPSLNVGFGQMVSLGNQATINSLDVIEQWENDDEISQILLYLESIENPIKFREVATRVARKKPIIAIKSGRSEKGAKATASHTGSLAGSDISADSLLSASGVIRTKGLKEMFDLSKVFEYCPIPKGNRLGILTNSGGPGILATDAGSENGMVIPTLSDNLRGKIADILMPQASTSNPVDVIASASCEHYLKTAELMLASGEIDMLLVIYLYITGKKDIELYQKLEDLKKKYPTIPIICTYMTTDDFEQQKQIETNSSIPTFRFVDDAVNGFKALLQRKAFLEESAVKTPVLKADKNIVKQIIEEANAEGVKKLSTLQSLAIFESYNLPIPAYGSANNLEQAKTIANKIGYPIVLKISSKTVSHKTDVGGVVVGIKTEQDLELQWNALMGRLEKAGLTNGLDGIVVMQQVKGKRELVAGAVYQGNYGYQIMFGIGGIYVEVLKEVAFRPCPLTMSDVRHLIYSTKASKIVGELRGDKAVNPTVLQETLLKLSQLVCDFPEILEVDANPIMIDDNGNLYTVDARVNLK